MTDTSVTRVRGAAAGYANLLHREDAARSDRRDAIREAGIDVASIDGAGG